MQSLSEQVINAIRSRNMEDEIPIQYVNQVIESLDENERSATEISRMANVTGGVARAVLTIAANSVENSPVKNNYMRFKLSESVSGRNSVSKSKESSSDKIVAKRDSIKDISKIIPSIISILHERPQTISSLADELDVNLDICTKIVKNLEDESAVIEDVSTEWPEPVYMLDNEGYKKYVERTTKKAEIRSENSKDLSTEAEQKVRGAQKETKNVAKEKPSSVEKIILELLNKEKELKISNIVKLTDTAITRIDIEDTLSRMTEKGVVSCDNPSKKHPVYFLTNTNATVVDKEVISSEEEVSKKTESPNTSVAATTKNDSVDTSSNDKKRPTQSNVKGNDSSNSTLVEAENATEGKAKQEMEESYDKLVTSPYSDVAALQMVLEDILPTLSASKRGQIERAIEGIERDKDKIKRAVGNLSKTINELM